MCIVKESLWTPGSFGVKLVTGKDGWQNTSVLLTCKRKGLQVSNPVGCSELTLSAGMAARCLLIDAPTCRMAGNCLMNRLLYVLHDSSFPGNEGPHSFGLNLDDRDLVVSVTWCMGGWKGEEAALRIFVRCQVHSPHLLPSSCSVL